MQHVNLAHILMQAARFSEVQVISGLWPQLNVPNVSKCAVSTSKSRD